MAFESFPRISVVDFNPDADLVQVFNKKTGTVGVINPSLLGGSTPPSGVSGAIQFSNGSAFASDASNLFWDNVNKRLGIGTNAPAYTFDLQSTSADPLRLKTTASYFRAIYQNAGGSGIFDFNSTNFQFPTNNVDFGTSTALGARVGIRGSGSTSATTSLLVQNSAGAAALTVRDDLSTLFAGSSVFSGSLSAGLLNTNQLLVTSINSQGNAFTVMQTNNTTGNARFFQNVSVGKITDPVASAALEVVSTTRGFLPPVMTTTQKNAIASPAAGLVLYDSTTNKLQCYNGSTWNDLF